MPSDSVPIILADGTRVSDHGELRKWDIILPEPKTGCYPYMDSFVTGDKNNGKWTLYLTNYGDCRFNNTDGAYENESDDDDDDDDDDDYANDEAPEMDIGSIAEHCEIDADDLATLLSEGLETDSGREAFVSIGNSLGQNYDPEDYNSIPSWTECIYQDSWMDNAELTYIRNIAA